MVRKLNNLGRCQTLDASPNGLPRISYFVWFVPDMSATTHRIVTKSPAGTHRAARSLLRGLGPGSVIALHGELGSGKTCFVQGLARALGIAEPVASPTFTLVHEYRGRLSLYHVDLYRIAGPREAQNLGLDEYLDVKYACIGIQG